MGNPVAQDGQLTVLCQRNLNRDMAMPKHKMIDRRLLLELSFGIMVKHLFFDLDFKIVFLFAGNIGNPAFLREIQPHTCSQIGMKPSEEPLIQSVFEDCFKQLISGVARAEPVAVRQKEDLLAKLANNSFAVKNHPNLLLKVIEGPDVVVSKENMNRNSAVGKRGDYPKKSGVAFRNDGFILEPEIEQIAHEVNLTGVVADTFKPMNEFFFPD